jgi:hypothetical protein
MGGFSAQVQPNQSSAPAGKGAGMSAMQMGQNPIQQSFPQKLENNLMQTESNQGAIDPTQNFMPVTGMMGGQVTMPGQGGQPQLGMPNAYSNTMQPWDNQAQQPQASGGKGMGGQMAKQMGKGA